MSVFTSPEATPPVATPDHVTTGEVAQFYGSPLTDWRVRRAVDALLTDVPRAGRYRLIPRGLLGPLASELQRRGWLPSTEEAVAP